MLTPARAVPHCPQKRAPSRNLVPHESHDANSDPVDEASMSAEDPSSGVPSLIEPDWSAAHFATSPLALMRPAESDAMAACRLPAGVLVAVEPASPPVRGALRVVADAPERGEEREPLGGGMAT